MTLITLTDDSFSNTCGDSAAVILISDGNDKLRGDFKTAFDKAGRRGRGHRLRAG